MRRFLFLCGGLLIATFMRAQVAEPDSTQVVDNVQLDSLYQSLPEIFVTGEHPVVKAEPDKLVYDMPRLLVNKPVDNIYDALKELPGVTEMNGGITLGGLGTTLVLDGKVTNMTTAELITLLKSMPAHRIKQVEIMYNASAKYQVRGAMINIILNHAVDGPSAAQGELYASYRNRHQSTINERASLLYTKGKISMDFLYAQTNGKSYHLSNDESLHTLIDGSQHRMDTRQVTHQQSHDHQMRWGMDYNITEKHQISVVYNGKYDKAHNQSNIGGAVNAESKIKTNNQLHNIRLDYKTPFGLKTGSEFTYYKSPETQWLDSELAREQWHYVIHNNQRINRWKFFASQEHRLNRNWNLNYGVIYNMSTDHSFQNYTQTKEESTTLPEDLSFKQTEDNLNIYAGLNKNLGKKLMTDISWAAEYYKSVVWKQWDFFPTMNITWLPKDGHTFQFSFSSNKMYPDYWAVKNFITYSKGGYGEIKGNPLLKPSNDYRTQIVYLLKNKYTFVAWYDYNKDKFTQLTYQRPDKLVMEYQYHNFDYTQQLGIQASFPVRIASWWKTNFTLIGVWQRDKDADFYDIPFDRSIFWTMAFMRNTIIFSSQPNISMTVNGMMRSMAYQGNYDLPASQNVDSAIRYKFARNRAILSLYANNIFESNAIYPRIHDKGQNYRMHYSDFREVGISFSYSFGGYKEKARQGVDISRFKN